MDTDTAAFGRVILRESDVSLSAIHAACMVEQVAYTSARRLASTRTYLKSKLELKYKYYYGKCLYSRLGIFVWSTASPEQKCIVELMTLCIGGHAFVRGAAPHR